MIKSRSLLAKLAKRFPKSIAKKYGDTVGLMCGDLPETTQKIVLCLDMDDTILDRVLSEKPDLIITHHPFIYKSRAQVFKNDPKRTALVETLEAKGMCVLSYHTNFDEGQGGMNDALAEALKLFDIHPLIGDPMARAGVLAEPMPVKTFAKYAKKLLNVDYGLLIAKGKPIISSVAIVGGGGSRTYSIAQTENIDLFISGDAPHHVRRGIVVDGYNYLDLPHEIERIFIPTMKKRLLEIDPSLNIVTIDHEELPEVI